MDVPACSYCGFCFFYVSPLQGLTGGATTVGTETGRVQHAKRERVVWCARRFLCQVVWGGEGSGGVGGDSGPNAEP